MTIYCTNCNTEATSFFEYEETGITPGVGITTRLRKVPLCLQCEDAFCIGQGHPKATFNDIDEWED